MSIIKLSESATEIATALIAMRDQAKLRAVADLLNLHLYREQPRRRRDAFDRMFDDIAAAKRRPRSVLD